MPALNPFSFPKGEWKLPKFKQMWARAKHRPLIGVTQGGSSRPGAPAKVAATTGQAKPLPINEKELLDNE